MVYVVSKSIGANKITIIDICIGLLIKSISLFVAKKLIDTLLRFIIYLPVKCSSLYSHLIYESTGVSYFVYAILYDISVNATLSITHMYLITSTHTSTCTLRNDAIQLFSQQNEMNIHKIWMPWKCIVCGEEVHMSTMKCVQIKLCLLWP